jgi:hypothetical protein
MLEYKKFKCLRINMAYTTINKSTDHFNTKLYTGTGSNQAITNVGFQPDLVWWKCRNVAKNHGITDSVRGNTKRIVPNSNGAESTVTDYVQSFDSDGFTAGSNGNMNSNGDTFCSWNWKAGTGQGSSNTDGSINTTYTSVNTTAGFSISSYTGTGSQATVGHGLGVAPKLIIIKRLQNAEDWAVYHASNGAGTYQSLNTTEAKNTNSNRFNVAPTSSVFTVNTHESVNYAENYIAYCFAEKTGYSKFGSYTGNGNADGTFVYTGFAPSFVMTKRSSDTQGWVMWDNKRPGYNVTNQSLTANESSVEETGRTFDILSNGFKLRDTNTATNAASTYIYMAFGQSVVGTNNIPATAR